MTYRICRALMRLFFLLMGSWKIEGKDYVPGTGPLIIAPNHISFLDPPLVGCALERPSWFMAKAELFRVSLIGRFLSALRAFPVQRGAADRAALKRTLDLLARGEAVTLFPEGTRSQTGELGEPELGVGMLALRSGAPVVPMAILGTDAVMPLGVRWLRRGRVRARFGKPLYFPPPEGKPGREEYAAVARRVMEEIRALREEMA